MSRAPAIASLLAAAVLTVFATGCSFSFSVGDSSPTEGVTEQIETAYEDRSGIALRSLECEEIEAEEDAEISCEGRNARGVDLVIDGRVTSAEGSEIDYHWDVAEAYISGDTYASAAVPVVERALETPVEGVRCERRVKIEVDALVGCEAKLASGQLIPMQLRLTDLDGGFEVLPPRQSPPPEA